MTPVRLVLLGTGMFADELTDLAASLPGVEVVAYVENLDRARVGTERRQRPVVWVDDLPQLGDVRAATAITTTERELYIRQVRKLGISFVTLVHPTAVVAPSAMLGEGVIVQPGAVIGACTTVGDHVTVNRGALIGHHVAIGELATIQPGAILGGATRIGARAYIGLGAKVLERRAVGEGALVGADALVTRDVEPHVKVLGSPARVTQAGVTGHASGASYATKA